MKRNISIAACKDSVTVIVAARGVCQEIDKCLNSLVMLDYPECEILVVDDGLTEEAIGVVNRFKDKVTIIKNDGKGASDARNCGARNSSAKYIAFTDADCIVSGNWLRGLIDGIESRPGIASCGGAQYLPEDATDFENYAFQFMKKVGFLTDYIKNDKNSSIVAVDHNPSCNVLYRRDIYLAVGGFLTGLWPGEDVEFDYRLRKKGHKIVFNPNAIVYHYRVKNIKEFKTMMSRYGLVQGMLVRRFGLFRTIQIIPFISFCGILIGGLFCAIGNTVWVAGAGIAGVAGGAVWSGFDFKLFQLICLGALKWHWHFYRGLFQRI